MNAIRFEHEENNGFYPLVKRRVADYFRGLEEPVRGPLSPAQSDHLWRTDRQLLHPRSDPSTAILDPTATGLRVRHRIPADGN